MVVISPLSIIHKDHLEQLRKRSISACRLNFCSKVDEATDEMGPFDIDTNVDLESVRNGHYFIVVYHPEALLNTRKGHSLLTTDSVFKDNVIEVVIDE